MLFEGQERAEVKLNAAPGIIELANALYKATRPYSRKVDLDELFEEMITVAALNRGLIKDENAPKLPATDLRELVKQNTQILWHINNLLLEEVEAQPTYPQQQLPPPSPQFYSDEVDPDSQQEDEDEGDVTEQPKGVTLGLMETVLGA